jgi:membrane-associated protease RseP (regulator of RpoE activity)
MLRILLALCATTVLFAVETASPPKLGIVVDTAAFDASKGVPVKAVMAGTTAATLGVQVGDLIAKINDAEIHSDVDIAKALSGMSVGQAVTLTVQRAGVAKVLAGNLLAPPTAANLLQELGDVRGDLNELKEAVGVRHREPSLAELLHELQMLQEQFPRAAAEFKKLYPDGEFSITIRITSDKNAKEPVDLMQLQDGKDGTLVPPPKPAPAPAPAPQP